MGRLEHVLLAFNRGKVSPLGLGRIEVKRIGLAAEEQTNFIPRVLGSMSLRPGLQYLGTSKSSNSARLIPFVFATTDTALLEMTATTMRVWVNDALVTRAGPSFTVPALSTWTDNDEAGSSSTWTGTYLQFVGTGTNSAIRDVQVTVGTPNVEHALRIVVARGPVYLRIGTSAGDDSYVHETTLRTGTHSIAFTPTGNFYIRLFGRRIPYSWVTSVTAESAGTLEVPTPFTANDLDSLRQEQSGNIIYLACDGMQQRMIERRDNNSWSVVTYAPDDGPFKAINVGPIQITPSATYGNITLTASKALFRSTDVGCLYQLIAVGQFNQQTLAAENTFTDGILVTGTGTNRTFTIILSGTWTGTTVTLQRSIGNTGVWEDHPSTGPWTANVTTTLADGLDNQTVAYRLGIKTGDYAGADSIVCTLSIETGSASGIVRLTGYTNATSVSAEVLDPLASTNPTDLWKKSEWSDTDGWPSAVALHEGRLWWAGKSKVWGSISDAYDSYTPDETGTSGVISRSIGSGPVDTVCWLSSNQRLLLGTQGTEFSARASTLDEPLSPTAFVMRPASSQGSSLVDVCKIDNRVVFVQRNGSKVYELSFDTRWYDYSPKDLTGIVPEIGWPSITSMAVQRQPDTRIHCVRSDGSLALAVQDKNEDMIAWVDVETDGSIEDVAVLPAPNGQLDDYVYYMVRRTINGATVRYLEKWAQQTECTGGPLNKQADSFVVKTPGSATITGLDHLEGEQVVVWADSADIGTADDYSLLYTVAGGSITVDRTVTQCVVGLPYTGSFLSMKIGSPTQDVSQVLNHCKNINHIGFVLAQTHRKGLRFGPDANVLDSMPDVEWGKPDTIEVHQTFDEQPVEFPGTWSTDARVYMKAQAPRPVTVLALDLGLEMT